jgi:hypothetical protein
MKMNRTRLIISAIMLSTMPVLQGCAALTAASTVGSVIDAVNQPVTIPLEVKKYYLRLLVGATGANHLAEAAVDTGLLKAGSPSAVFVADRLLDLDKVVKAARTAYHLKDARTLQEKINAGNSILDQITPYLGQ